MGRTFLRLLEPWGALLGPALLLAGVVADAVGQERGPVTTVIVGSIALALVGYFFYQFKEKRLLRERMLRYEARRDAVEGELQQIETDIRDGLDARLVRGYVDFAIDQVLCLASTITDDPADALSANYMTFDEAEQKLRITQIFGVYSRLRVRQGRDVRDADGRGTCGLAFDMGETLFIPRLVEHPAYVRSSPEEKDILGGVINIPVPADPATAGPPFVGVLNIDSPRPGRLHPESKRLQERSRELQRLMARAQLIYRRLEAAKASAAVPAPALAVRPEPAPAP
jgi:hypothetical protein